MNKNQRIATNCHIVSFWDCSIVNLWNEEKLGGFLKNGFLSFYVKKWTRTRFQLDGEHSRSQESLGCQSLTPRLQCVFCLADGLSKGWFYTRGEIEQNALKLSFCMVSFRKQATCRSVYVPQTKETAVCQTLNILGEFFKGLLPTVM